MKRQPLGEILIEAGLISPSQIEFALQEQSLNNLRIGEILALYGWLNQKTADFFVEKWPEILESKKKKPLVYYFHQAGLLDESQINILLEEQQHRKGKVRFHHLAVEYGYLEQITVDFFLAKIFNIYSSTGFSFTKPYEIIRGYTKGQRDFTKIELAKAPLMDLSLKEVRLDGCNLREANLTRVNLSNSSLIQVNLYLANLAKAILISVNFERAFLDQANLQETNLERANFKGASLKEVDLTEAYLYQTSFAGADLRGAKLPSEYPYEVYYDSQTIFDNNFDPKRVGWKIKESIPWGDSSNK